LPAELTSSTFQGFTIKAPLMTLAELMNSLTIATPEDDQEGENKREKWERSRVKNLTLQTRVVEETNLGWPAQPLQCGAW
jgi:hypothetical protein